MKKSAIILLAIVIILVIAVVVAIIIVKPSGQNRANNKNGSLKNTEIAKEIYGFLATIKKIDDKILTLEGSIPATSGESIKATAKVLITDQTKIVGLKFPIEIEDRTQPVYPEETALKLSDLKVGDDINVASATNISDNIKNGTQFPLITILVIGK